ncbi:7266_t:CDS:2 [Entrophospora sp. SA101]|nr:7266_t:CDS:2 [Entrophospora sp. SA101]
MRSGENKKLKFRLKIVLKNCVDGEIGGTVYSTSVAEKAVREIKNAEVTGVVDRHKNGENIDETAEVGGDGKVKELSGKKVIEITWDENNIGENKKEGDLITFEKDEFKRGMTPPGQHEKQLKNLYLELEKKEGNTIQHILSHLIPRLDKVIFRSVEPNDVISLREKTRDNKLIQQQLQQNVKTPDFLKLDKEKLEITYLRHPSMEELEKEVEGINIASVVA